MFIEDFSHFGATERMAGALRNILDYYNVVSPHSNEPFTEALLMGIGGGLGAEYATWAFKGIDPTRLPRSSLYLRFHHVKNYIEKKEETFIQKLTKRLGSHLAVKETASQERAGQFLSAALTAGKPVMVQLSVWHSVYSRQAVHDHYFKKPELFPSLLYDEFVSFLPYYSLPYPWISCHLATVYGMHEGYVHLSDYSNQPLTVGAEQFKESRSIIKGWKNRAYTIEPPNTHPNLTKAIRQGINDCVRSLLFDKAVVSGAHLRTKAWKAMATNIGDFKSKNGWLTRFQEPWQLFDTLSRLHAQIAFYNSDGGALRSSYADFLEEASDILKKSDLKPISHQFADIGIMWDEIGTTALNDDIPELLKARQTALDWHNMFKIHGNIQTELLTNLSKKLQAIRIKFNEETPITNRELLALFEELSVRFREVYEAEKTALQDLRKAMK